MKVYLLRKYDTVYIYTKHNEKLKKYIHCSSFKYKDLADYTNILTANGFTIVYGNILSKL